MQRHKVWREQWFEATSEGSFKGSEGYYARR